MGYLRSIGILSLVFCSGCFGGRESQEIEVGFQGLAARNPYLGAQRLAEELGYEAQGTTLLTQMPSTDWVLLMRDGTMTGGEPQAMDLLQWVEEGGDLWVDMADYNGTEESEPETGIEDGPAQWALYTLLDELELHVVINGGDSGEGLASAAGLTLPWPDGDVLLGDPEDRAFEYWGRSSHAAMLHMPWGAGSVHFFASMSGFDNDHLPNGDWAELFAHLLENSDPGNPAQGFLVVYGGSRSFMSLLWKHAWFFLVALAALTVVWLWRVSRRFGPVLEGPAWDPEGVGIGGGREFVEHIYAAGRTYERNGQINLLVRAARDYCKAETLPNELDGESSPEVEMAPKASRNFTQLIKTLQGTALRGSGGQRSTNLNPEKDND